MPEDLSSFFSGLKFGETVIIEYQSTSYPEVLFHLLQNFCSANSMQVLIDDIVDTYPQFVSGMKALGFEPGSALVIKIGGGKIEAGTVVERLDVDKYSIPVNHYRNVVGRIPNLREEYINPVLGVHKFPLLLTKRELLSFLATVSTFVGDTSRIAVYFINRDVVDAIEPSFLPMFEEIATTVAEWYRDGSDFVLSVIKAANPELLEKEYRLKVEEVLKG
ncbi:hypothetical protein A3L09_01995 [Thermococcus profundus]|uniref:Uncharacterized protein n=1 Tax=Thermococcus profundus TaxID=49899 RepID=A0A2Z2M8V6_THEPR|nr:DUF257 family protein [Thermococcus profundus]ASJ02126.1 hypothetical protein A3L09_01995 [Thermococcus profundus]